MPVPPVETPCVDVNARVLSISRPAGLSLPLVLDSPHSGTTYPDDFGYVCPIPILRSAEDTFVDDLWAAAPAQGAPLLRAHFPRNYIDPNRALSDIDPALVAGSWPEPLIPTEKTVRGKGLIWRSLIDGTSIYARKLTVDEIQHRIDTYWRPYHRALKALLDEVHARVGSVWHINCHSMPRVAGVSGPEPAGTRRADYVLGDRDGTVSDPGFVDLVEQVLLSRGRSVTRNVPYKGAELVAAYADPGTSRFSLQIEISRDLYMDDSHFVRNAGFSDVEADCTAILDAACAYIRARVRA